MGPGSEPWEGAGPCPNAGPEEDRNFPPQGGAALQPGRPPGGAEQRLRQGHRPTGANLHVEWRGQCPGERPAPSPSTPAVGIPDGGLGVRRGLCQARRGWSCPSPACSWSWTLSMPTRRAASAGTSTGSRPSMSSMPTVSAARVGGAGSQVRAGQSQGAGAVGAHWALEGVGVLGMASPRAWPPELLLCPHTECLLSPDTRLTPLQFGNLQKLDGPTEQCQDPQPSPADNCTDEVSPWSQGVGQRGWTQASRGRDPGRPGERGSPTPRAAEDLASTFEVHPLHPHSSLHCTHLRV